MPQLEVSTFIPQLFWLAVMFGLLYLLMATIGLPRLGGIIEARRQRIDDDLSQAAVKETTDRLAAEAAERQRRLGETLAQQTAAAEREIATAKQKALSEMHAIAVEVGRSIAEKVTGTAPDPFGLAAAVDRVLAERAG